MHTFLFITFGLNHHNHSLNKSIPTHIEFVENRWGERFFANCCLFDNLHFLCLHFWWIFIEFHWNADLHPLKLNQFRLLWGQVALLLELVDLVLKEIHPLVSPTLLILWLFMLLSQYIIDVRFILVRAPYL